MASNKIKGLTVEIGGDTTKLGKALDNVEKQGKGLSGELKEINRLLKLDPSNVDLLAQKQKVLADAVANTESKLDTLKEAERQVQAQFEKGEASEEQVRALQREIIATEKALENYNRAARETADAMDQVAKETKEAGQEVDKLGEEAKDTDGETEELGSSLDGLGTGLGVITAAVGAAVAGLAALTEETREYRREMGKLDVAFQDNGHSSEAAQNTYKALQGVLGETDQAVEAANHLAALADTEEELAEWTDILTGVYGKFGVSLPIEGLAEAANETARTGALTGGLTDALNWAAEAGETFGVKLKKNTKKNEEFNKKVKEATTAEEFFQIALDECSTEQERQQLITKTLTKLYKGAADQYKETNKEIIRANEANEAWTATLAGIGAEMEPVLTDIKEMGTSLVKDLEAPLKSVVSWIRDKLLPALSNMGSWIKQNGPIIKATIAGVTAALVAYKVATIAAEVSQKGLKGAILATEAAQKLLNLTTAATPWGMVAVAAAALTAALVALGVSMTDAKGPADVLTQEERELMAAAEETAKAFDDQKAATDKALAGVTAEMNHVQALADELRTLADEKGNVKKTDEERVNFILGELNGALGTEYKMVDGVIKKYSDLKKSIDQVIQSKLADALLETANADYIAAVQAKDEAMGRMVATEKEYQAQLEISNEASKKATDARVALNEKVANAKSEADLRSLASEASYVTELERLAKVEKGTLDEKKAAREEAAGQYGEYVNTINTYEEAQAAVLAGNTQVAVDLLSKKGGAYVEYSDKVDEETAKVLNTLYQEAIDAGIEAERIKKNFENGVEGYTKQMVQEADESYRKAMDAYATAYADAEGVGEDIGGGMAAGMENERSSLLQKARSLVKGIISAFRKEADSHSPSRKMIAFGEDMGEGAEIGLDEKTDDILKTAKHQVQAMLEVYNGNDNSAAVQQSLAAVTSKQQAQAAQAAASSAAQLDKILAAIERGQILTIDGSALVGATAGKMDNTLGQRRALAARGAL